MSPPVRIARYAMVHAHMTWNITPGGGNNLGIPWTVRTCTSFDYGLGTKYGSVGGNQFRPTAAGLTGSEPKWSAELSMGEIRDIRRHIGQGWAAIPLQFEVTWQQIGTNTSSFTDEYFDCFFGDDGTNSKYGSDIVMGKTGSLCTNIILDGLDAFDPDAQAGG